MYLATTDNAASGKNTISSSDWELPIRIIVEKVLDFSNAPKSVFMSYLNSMQYVAV